MTLKPGYLGGRCQLYSEPITTIFSKKNAFGNVVCKMLTIVPWTQCIEFFIWKVISFSGWGCVTVPHEVKVLRGVPLQQAAFAPSMDDPFLTVLSEGMTHQHNNPLRAYVSRPLERHHVSILAPQISGNSTVDLFCNLFRITFDKTSKIRISVPLCEGNRQWNAENSCYDHALTDCFVFTRYNVNVYE